MASTRHTLGQVEGSGALFIAGTCTPSGGNVATLSNLVGPLAMQADMTATLASSVFTLTVAPFIGPLGNAVAMVCPTATSGIVRVDSQTYTADSLAVVVKTFNVDGTTAADKAFNFEIWAS